MTPDEMIELLLDPQSDAMDGRVVNDLLSEVGRGYPIESLRRLFVPTAFGDAAFLVSELGEKARPLINDIALLIEQGGPRVRGDAISALSMCTTWEDGWAVSKVVTGLGDQHEGVRWITSRALRYMESKTLHAGLEYLKREQPNSVYAQFKNVFQLLERRPENATATLQRLLIHDDEIARRFAAAMAVRPRLFIDRAFVALAESSPDTEVAEIARDAIDTQLPPWAIWTDSRRSEVG